VIVNRSIGKKHVRSVPVRPIQSESGYDAALAEIERYFNNEPKLGTAAADRFELLASLIEHYENRRWPIEPPDSPLHSAVEHKRQS
jgi:antitoxin component HigA of HigAB toxin-antitoxin module